MTINYIFIVHHNKYLDVDELQSSPKQKIHMSPQLFAGENYECLFIVDSDTYMHSLSIDMQNKHIQSKQR